MSEKRADNFFLTVDEISILLMLSGMETMYGFQSEKQKGFSEKEAKEAVFSLGRKGFAKEEKGNIKLIDSLKEVIDIIVNASIVVSAKRQGMDFNTLCLYANGNSWEERVVCVEIAGAEEIFRVGMMKDIISCLDEKGFLPEQLLEDNVLYQPEEILPDKKWDENDWQSGIELVNAKTGELLGELLFYKRPITDLLVEREAEGKRIFAYSKKMIRERLDMQLERSVI